MKNVMAEPKSGCKVTVKGEGISVERNISEALARDIITMILVGGGDSQISPRAQTSTTMSPQQRNNSGSPRKSLREYFIEVGAKKNPQKILAIAGYLNNFVGKTTFSISDIRPQFRAANEPIPANLTRDFQTVVQYGWIAPDHVEHKMFFVTQTGLDELANGFK